MMVVIMFIIDFNFCVDFGVVDVGDVDGGVLEKVVGYRVMFEVML